MAKAPLKIKATVVRGSYWAVDEDGNRTHMIPDQGDDSDLMVTEQQLSAAIGVLVRKSLLEAELEKVRSERMQSVTPTNVATEPTKASGLVGTVISKLGGGSDAGNAS
jgi:hypothetical protein